MVPYPELFCIPRFFYTGSSSDYLSLVLPGPELVRCYMTQVLRPEVFKVYLAALEPLGWLTGF